MKKSNLNLFFICLALICATLFQACRTGYYCVYTGNPLDSLYRAITNTDSLIIKDSDHDGVLDYYDKEPNTVEFAAVNYNGVTLDSDKDGCFDYEDPEPFSSPVLPLRDCKFESFICDTKDPPSCREIKKSDIDSNFFLPIIMFKLNSAVIEPDQISELNYIADIISGYSDLHLNIRNMILTNYNVKENFGIGMDRMKMVITQLSLLGISQDFFSVEFFQEERRIIVDTEGAPIGLIVFTVPRN